MERKYEYYWVFLTFEIISIKLKILKELRNCFFFFNTGFPKLAYSTYSFEELVLVVCLCFPCFLLVLCFEFNATICIMVIYISATCSTIFSNITTCKNIKNLLWNVDYHLQQKLCSQWGFELLRKCI